MKNKFLLRLVQGVRAVFIVFAGMLLCLTLAACTEKPAKGPTAIVIDAATGKSVGWAVPTIL